MKKAKDDSIYGDIPLRRGDRKTAYNRDPDASLDQLRQYSKVRSFHFDLISSSGTEYFSYRELSVDWYNHINNNH